jgi:type I site-specific restriction-modification system R (restriction) subunit
MAATAGLKHCVTCGREKTTFRCGGCLQEFCFNHLNDHQKELSKQLQEVEVTCDRLRQTLNEDTTDSQKYALIEQINDWEREAIKKIQQAAEEERQKLLKYKIEHKIQIEADLNKLTDELRQSREDNDFHETHLNRWNEELRKLREELAKPLNTDLQLGSSLINKIFLDITSGKYISLCIFEFCCTYRKFL